MSKEHSFANPKGQCKIKLKDCKFINNCQYKQLKRLEQENAKLKAELQKYKDMEAKGLEEFKDVGGCWGCGLQLQLNQDLEDIKQLKAENERLKEELATYGATGVCEVCSDKANKLADKYFGCLQEIKKIAENQDLYRGRQAIATKILDLIIKAESEEE